MRYNFLKNSLYLIAVLLISVMILGLEPAFYHSNNNSVPWHQHHKLVKDTRVKVELKHKQRIFSWVDQATPNLLVQDKWQLARFICRESQEYGIDPRLIIALIQTESSFRNEALSPAGARGLMQIRFHTAREIAREMGIEWKGVKILYEPQLNIRMGTYYLAKMLKRFEDLELALTAYNIGPTLVGRLMFCQTNIPRKYSRRVLTNYRLLSHTAHETL